MHRQIVKKIKGLSPAVKASIAFFAASLVSKGLSFITTPIFTRILTDAEYGSISVFFSYLTLIGTVAMFCLNYGVFNNGMLDFPDDRNKYTTSLLILSNIITTAVLVLFLCFKDYLIDYTGIDFNCWLLMFGVFYTQPAFNFWLARQRYEYKYKLSTIATISSTIIPTVIAILAIRLSTNHVYARLFGSELTLIIFYVGFYIYNVKQSGLNNISKYWKYAFTFNLTVIPHYLSIYVLTSSDRIMIDRIIGSEHAAYYSVAYAIGAVVAIMWTAINSSLIPFTYENCKIENYKVIKNVSNIILTVYGAFCFVIMLFAPEFIAIMAPSSYKLGVYAIPPVIVGTYLQAHYSLFVNLLYYAKKPKYAMFASLTSAILNIILNAWLIPIFGIVAAGFTTLFSYLVQAVIDYFGLRKSRMNNVYDIKYIVLITVFVMVGMTSAFLYSNSGIFLIMRVVIFVALLVAIFMKRNIIINAVKTMKKSGE